MNRNNNKAEIRVRKKMDYERGGLAFAGGLFLGSGFGMLFDNVAAGATIGRGLGFLAMAFFGKRKS
jgi:hypothetical protein